jgi:MinD-like ATPase involved in chromosome partitioning or flagellar assembly
MAETIAVLSQKGGTGKATAVRTLETMTASRMVTSNG